MQVRILSLLVVFLWPLYADAQTIDQILKKYVKSIGGERNWKKVKTITTSGEYNYGGIVFPYTSYSKTPNLYKFVVPFNGKYYAQAFDGINGWKIDAFKNETSPTLLSGKPARAMANEADVELEDALINYSEKGHQAVLEGRDTIQGKTCYNVKFTRKSGDVEHYYFNDKTLELIMKKAISKNVELEGALLTIYYSDYRDVGGIRFPYRAICESNGQMILTITIEKVALNTAIDDNEFQP